MTTLLLKFSISLKRFDVSTTYQGPIFHRWLPDGEQDSIILDAENLNATIKLWFERRGFVRNNMIEFDYKRREVDPVIINKQGSLEAGPLMGSVEIRELREDEINSVIENRVGDAEYEALGKKIVNKILYPSVSKLLNVLNCNYGQYWIRTLEKWDSRDESLGKYCHYLNLQWSIDNGVTWSPFMPNKMEVYISAKGSSLSSFRQFLTKDDWEKLTKSLQVGYEPSFAAFILARTHRLSDENNIRYALIEAGTAFELAFSEFVHIRLHKDKQLQIFVERLLEMPLTVQITTVATFINDISLDDTNKAIKAISLRNKVVHEGYELSPLDGAKEALSSLQKVIIVLLQEPNFKFPRANQGNRVTSIEEWEKDLL